MNLLKFGEFLIKSSNGKIKETDIVNAINKQNQYYTEYRKIGEILLKEKVITKNELIKYIVQYERFKYRDEFTFNNKKLYS